MQRLVSVKNQTVADAIGKDQSTVSRIVSGETGIKLDDLQPFLAALNLKVVDGNQVCVDKAVYESYRTLAAAAITNPRILDWDDPT